jgi:hypothetical protein
MNQRLMFSLVAALTVTLSLGGCGDGGDGAETVTETSASPTETRASATETSGSAMDAVKEQAQAAMDSASQAGSQAMQALTEAAGLAEEQTEMLSASAQTELREMIDQVKTYLENNNLTSAEDLMAKLGELKDALPESMREQIDALEIKLDNLQGQDQN